MEWTTVLVALIGVVSAGVGGIVSIIVADRRDRWLREAEERDAEREEKRTDRDRLIQYYERDVAFWRSEAAYWREQTERGKGNTRAAIEVGEHAATQLAETTAVSPSDPASEG